MPSLLCQSMATVLKPSPDGLFALTQLPQIIRGRPLSQTSLSSSGCALHALRVNHPSGLATTCLCGTLCRECLRPLALSSGAVRLGAYLEFEETAHASA